MTPDEFNALVNEIIAALDGAEGIGTVSAGIPADTDGTLPEVYVEVNGTDLALVVTPL